MINFLQNKYWKRGLLTFTAFGLLQMIGPTVAKAADAAPDLAAQLADMRVGADTVWTMIAGFLVFFMNAGFGLVESGFCRSKNAVNILAKNFVVFALSMLAFWVIGFGLMFGNGTSIVGTEGMFLLTGADNSPAMGDAYKGAYSSIAWTGVPLFAKFFFQSVFAGTAATIVSGAVAERIKFLSFCLFSVVLVGIFYPITGHWIWGGGWLASFGETGFWDFAGSTVVHSVGGWAALAGVIVLGPRIGKYEKGGKINAIPGHNMTNAFLGGLILWLGWFGFNPGSTMAMLPNDITLIALTTAIAACAGTVTATITATIVGGKPDFGMIVNGCLAGLVAITAACAWVTPGSAFFIGAIAGVLVVLSVNALDRLHLDDPVGAVSVHLVCGVFGTLCVGLFAEGIAGNAANTGLLVGGGFGLLTSQIVGVLAVGVFTFVLSLVVWAVLKATIGIRVSAEEEIEGLDYGEHGNTAYPDFTRSM